MRSAIFFILLVYNLGYCQNNIPTPTNIICTSSKIIGNSAPQTIVKFFIDDNSTAINTIIVNYLGYFESDITSLLTQTPAISPIPETRIITIWSENENGTKSEIIKVNMESTDLILGKIQSGKITLPNKKNDKYFPNPYNPNILGDQPASTTYKYSATLLNTNFTIPIARFNLVTDETDTKMGDILLFNSIGAGIGLSTGTYEKTTDAKGETINTEFTNSFGIHFGVLFSAGSTDTANKNIFAPTLSLSVLDFHFGYGYELGTIEINQKRSFFTIAYAIPISKLINGKYYIFQSTQGYNSQNPLPVQEEEEGNNKTSLIKKVKSIRSKINSLIN